jgi:penicillin-binding protein 2
MNLLNNKKYLISGIVLLVGMIFIVRLFYIQVLDDSYKMNADNQAFRYLTEFPARGYIYDRNNKLLVCNEPAYDLMVLPKEISKDRFDTAAFCSIIGITKEIFLKKMKKAMQAPNSPRKESVFEKQLSSKDYAGLQERFFRLNGFTVQSPTLRK